MESYTNIELYNNAKEAYYKGNPIMTDIEFDELERSLGLENRSYVGAHHNPSYTIEHPFIMGSLSKVQIHSKDGDIDWTNYLSDIYKYIYKNVDSCECVISPKYDGCSFEAHIRNNIIESISTRGDGYYGRDIYNHIINKVKGNVEILNPQLDTDEYVLRGEVLIDKGVFNDKYSDFVNPRSFVAGILNRDYDENDGELMDYLNDLSIVIYDIRVDEEGNWVDYDWHTYEYTNKPRFYEITEISTSKQLESIYNKFESYRNESSEYALDGIVIKPIAGFRENNISLERPIDCVAVKFIPQLQESEVVDIEWSIKKTDELNPVVIVKPVIMDGKEVSRASGHNYGYLLDNKISIGTKVILSLAGDIIPFIYKITDTSAFDENKMCIPQNIDTVIDGVHLRKIMTPEEINKQSFMTSAAQLNIPNIGPSAADTIYNYLLVNNDDSIDEFLGIDDKKEIPNNILMVSPNDIDNALGGKLGKNAKKSFQEYINNIRLKDIILSCGYSFCGNKVAEKIESYWLDGIKDFSSMASEGYEWAVNESSDKYYKVMSILDHMNMSIDDFRKVHISSKPNSDAIPVILTGEPNDYASKGEFLNCHPEYRLTTSWKEVKIVFTNSFDSNTGKMKKAKEKNIELRLY